MMRYKESNIKDKFFYDNQDPIILSSSEFNKCFINDDDYDKFKLKNYLIYKNGNNYNNFKKLIANKIGFNHFRYKKYQTIRLISLHFGNLADYIMDKGYTK